MNVLKVSLLFPVAVGAALGTTFHSIQSYVCSQIDIPSGQHLVAADGGFIEGSCAADGFTQFLETSEKTFRVNTKQSLRGKSSKIFPVYVFTQEIIQSNGKNYGDPIGASGSDSADKLSMQRHHHNPTGASGATGSGSGSGSGSDSVELSATPVCLTFDDFGECLKWSPPNMLIRNGNPTGASGATGSGSGSGCGSDFVIGNTLEQLKSINTV
jgi:hypothetical protein